MQIERLFTTDTVDPYESCPFRVRTDSYMVPEDWSLEAEEIFAEALYHEAPTARRPVEENTLPSWLWQRRAKGENTLPEDSAQQVFDRVAGAATYAGWKRGLLNNENEASAFYDEVRFLLAKRLIAMEPQQLSSIGLDWAYGVKTGPRSDTSKQAFAEETITNEDIDSILGHKNAEARKKWEKFLQGDAERNPITLNFVDTASEWGSAKNSKAPRLMIDLLRFRTENGAVDVPALQQATRLSVMLLDLHYEQILSPDPARALAIGFCNLSSLLMSLVLPYDSNAGRATAAALSAIITAEATATSSELAGLFGPCPTFASQREVKLRALRNQRRAAYGEHNDYEHLMVLPMALEVESGADLVLIAAARRRWDEAITLVQQNGLRHLNLTTLFEAPSFSAFLESSAQGIEPEKTLVTYRSLSPDVYEREVRPSVLLALEKIGCTQEDIDHIVDDAVGTNTLENAPGINHAALRARGFDDVALEKLESYLPEVDHIRYAFTAEVLGEELFRKLKAGAACNDLLRHLGFSEEEIAAANAYCCGRRTVIGAHELPKEAAALFTSANALSQIRMAAAVQSFIMGDANLMITIQDTETLEQRDEFLLAAWQQGVKSITLYFEGLHTAKTGHKLSRQIPAVVTPVLPARKISAQMASPRAAKPKATSRTVSLKRGNAKAPLGIRAKGD